LLKKLSSARCLLCLVLVAVVVPASADPAASEANEVSDKVKEDAQHKGKGNREVESCGLRVAG
jgi:hypothetical protein